MMNKDPYNKVILTDCDGVLLNWGYAFSIYMQQQGCEKRHEGWGSYNVADNFYISKEQAKYHIRMFNQSAAIGFLPALRDAAHWVPKIHKELGYVFHCITSLSKDYSAQQLRKQNLEKIFGDTCFEKIICLDTGENKDRILKEYQDSGYLWIEDKVQNAECGLKYGLDSVLFEHGFNMDNEQFKKYPTWESIYEDLKSA